MANQQKTNAGLRELALFAGAGGGILGGKLLGWRTVCAVEWDAYAASVLVSRQNDNCLEAFPVWDDVQTFDGKPWRGLVDVVSGGFPCTDISCAGKGAGIDGDASSMWEHMARIIGEIRPRYAFVENSPILTFRGLDRVLGDISSLGYDAQWGIISAASLGASHKRDRMWILAFLPDTSSKFTQIPRQCWGKRWSQMGEEEWNIGSIFADASQFLRESDGVPNKLDRLRCCGNAQVPIVAATAWRILGGE